jgi:hypothetical protein
MTLLSALALVVTLDGLSSPAPADWKEQPVSGPMRVKHFIVPRVAGDTRDAEVIVFYFGAGQGGDPEQNVARWRSMFDPPGGKVETFKVGAVKTTVLDVSGTYLFKARPVDPSLEAERRPDHRMIGVVFETPNGPYFIRFVGPQKTVAKHKPAFDAWLKGFKKGVP